MVTDIDIKDAVYALISSSELPSLISGHVYKDSRPLNSDKEDISISVLAGDAAQAQSFVLNVNLFVPDVNRGNDHIEDSPRLRTLCSKCAEVLHNKVVGGFWYRLDWQRVMAVNEADFHFINNRLNVACCNG